MTRARVCVLGLGYVGLPTAALLAHSGAYEVVGVDIDPQRRARVEHGDDDALEPGLRELVAEVVGAGALRVAARPEAADVFVIAVPTPLAARPGADPSADLGALAAASASVAAVLRAGNLVIVESTSPPGTTTGLVAQTLATSGLTAGPDFDLAYCPERMLPGHALRELVDNARTLGGLTPRAAERAAALYRSFVRGPLTLTDCLTAEVVKLAENVFRDVNIALANELARVCGALGVDVHTVIAQANQHPRVSFLRPGVGVGGHCVSVDPWFLVDASPAQATLIRTARRVNDAQPRWAASRVASALAALALPAADCPRVAVLGVSYKPDVDDARETPVAALLDALVEVCPQAELRLVDPHVRTWSRPLVPLEEAVAGADLVVMTVAHAAWLALDPAAVGGPMRRREVFDLTGALDLERWRAAGFSARGL